MRHLWRRLWQVLRHPLLRAIWCMLLHKRRFRWRPWHRSRAGTGATDVHRTIEMIESNLTRSSVCLHIENIPALLEIQNATPGLFPNHGKMVLAPNLLSCQFVLAGAEAACYVRNAMPRQESAQGVYGPLHRFLPALASPHQERIFLSHASWTQGCRAPLCHPDPHPLCAKVCNRLGFDLKWEGIGATHHLYCSVEMVEAHPSFDNEDVLPQAFTHLVDGHAAAVKNVPNLLVVHLCWDVPGIAPARPGAKRAPWELVTLNAMCL